MNERTNGSRDDAPRIQVTREYEVEYWSTRLKVHPQQLVAAVRKVGPLVENVRREIGA